MIRRHAADIFRNILVIAGIWLLLQSVHTFQGISLIPALRQEFRIQMIREWIPGITYQQSDGKSGIFMREVLRFLPVYRYLMEEPGHEVDNRELYDRIRWKEGIDEEKEEEKQVEQNLEEKNEKKESETAPEAEREDELETETPIDEYANETGFPTMTQEQMTRVRTKMSDFDYLVSHFYSVDRTTTIRPEDLCASELLEKDLTLAPDDSKVQILIYHTHSLEAYADGNGMGERGTVVGVGDLLAKRLGEAGYGVYHDKTAYDRENRDYAYAKAEPGLRKFLQEHPDTQVIIDLHRDGVAEDTHLVSSVAGKRTAQFMFFNGLSRTTANGELTELPNPYLKDNLAFSLQLQLKAMEQCNGVARKIYLKGYRYNMHFCARSLLVEIGAQNNTVEEAENAVEPLSGVLLSVLLGNNKE